MDDDFRGGAAVSIYLSFTSAEIGERGAAAPRARRLPAIRSANLSVRRAGDVTEQERNQAEALISRLEIAVGQIAPRDGGNASVIASMIQLLNGLRSVLGIVRPH
jgi:hypothetical protein